MSTTVSCPNCGGSGHAGEIPLAGGKRQVGRCAICNGSGTVPDWDYERLSKLSTKNELQMELEF